MLNKKIPFFFLMILIVSLGFAQKNLGEDEIVINQLLGFGEDGNSQSETAEKNKIVQPFSWVSAGDVLKYEIKIEKFDEAKNSFEEYFFHETNEEETENCIIYFDPPLPVGHYKERIRVFNLLGAIEESLTYIEEFDVHQAYKPEIKNVSYPLYMRNVIYLDDLDNDGILEVSGKNLFLIDEDKAEGSTKYFLQRGRPIFPKKVVSHDSKNRSIRLQFDMKDLDVGEYQLVAQDSSGLHSEINPDSVFTVKFKKLVDLDLEAGYVLPVVVQDNTIPTYFEKTMPVSAQAKLNFMFYKRRWGYLGLALRGSYSRLKKSGEKYTIDGNFGTTHLMFAYQLPLFRRRVMFELHGGPGGAYFNNIVFHFPYNIDSAPLNTISLSFDAGLSAQIYINKRLYSELGCDYVLTKNSDILVGMVMPYAGVGWQF